ncbi:MAG TPA: prenyltransferase/squalene oxidase repeat-containing protein [Planctomycetota bacterium]|nr:prenyltransferase/squalene oxidase repeat-containing protein [Planctomycetota bacterium]
MADELNPIPAEETELDQYVDQEPSKWEEFLNRQLRRSPWWAISFLVHIIAMLILWSWPYDAMGRETIFSHVPVDLVPEVVPEIPPEPPEPPEVETIEEELDVPIEDIPISPEPVSKDDPGPDLGLDPTEDIMKDVERPLTSIDPPSNTPVFAVDSPSANRMTRGIYSGRRNFGTGKVPGGRGGSSRHAESAVMAGLIWLAKAQENDGSWSCKKWDGGGDFDVGMTGLALLAFLGAGYTHTKGKFKTTVEKGLEWFAKNQRDNGSFGWKTFYEMGIATMAVSEAYGLTQSPAVGRMAQKAIDYVCKVQPDHGGFRYGGAVPKDEGDMSVTGWQIMAIKSAICSELKVPQEAVERSRVFLKNTYRDYGGSAYIVSSRGAGAAVSAIGMLCRQFLGGDYDAEISAAADFLRQRQKNQVGAPNTGKDHLVGDLYYTYYSVLAMFQMGGEYWTDWNKLFRDPLVKCQIHQINDAKGRFVRGSWDPDNHQWAKSRGGRVYATAMAVLSLEVYYRFLPVYKK